MSALDLTPIREEIALVLARVAAHAAAGAHHAQAGCDRALALELRCAAAAVMSAASLAGHLRPAPWQHDRGHRGGHAA